MIRMNMRALVLVGGGGHCRSVADAAESSRVAILGVVDPAAREALLGCYPVLGGDDVIAQYARRADCDFVVTLGSVSDPSARIRLHELIRQAGGRLGRVVAATAHVSAHAEVGEGTVVLHGATVNAGARVGVGCIINSHANVDHDAQVGDYCHVSTGAMVNGGAVVGRATFVGSGAVVNQGVSVAPNCVIGSGAVVTADITEPGVYVGVPARKL